MTTEANAAASPAPDKKTTPAANRFRLFVIVVVTIVLDVFTVADSDSKAMLIGSAGGYHEVVCD